MPHGYSELLPANSYVGQLLKRAHMEFKKLGRSVTKDNLGDPIVDDIVLPGRNMKLVGVQCHRAIPTPKVDFRYEMHFRVVPHLTNNERGYQSAIKILEKNLGPCSFISEKGNLFNYRIGNVGKKVVIKEYFGEEDGLIEESPLLGALLVRISDASYDLAELRKIEAADIEGWDGPNHFPFKTKKFKYNELDEWLANMNTEIERIMDAYEFQGKPIPKDLPNPFKF